MAQGKLKTKVKLPKGVKQKSAVHKKGASGRKGGGFKAPKKAKLTETVKLQKALTKEINEQIEKEARYQAGKVEPKSFHIVKKAEKIEGKKKAK